MTAQHNQNSQPPVAPDASQIFNRIALATAKHERILSTLSKHRTASTFSPTTLTSTGGGFSSLTIRTTPTPSDGTQPPHQAQDRPSRKAQADDADLLYSQPPNAGVGYSPSPSPSAQSSSSGAGAQDKVTMMLRRKVLGRNAARQLAERERQRNGKKRGLAGVGSGGGGESESEEEVGKTALVRSRGNRGNRAKAGEEDGKGKGKKEGGATSSSSTAVAGGGGGGGGGENGLSESGSESKAGEKGNDKGMPRRKKARVEEGEKDDKGDSIAGLAETEKTDVGGDVVMGETGSAVEGQTGGEKKRKRKNKKKQRKAADRKAADAKARAEAGETGTDAED
ncbi:hypothetical protein N657DRAFT_646491 [Parathielavia appendiculata]|uniref:Uncharacterized protein n=1 Tax=Parathielavia appendiculata TaxID=2587402 RepID=A0AAN6Z2C2_9PEZI|nr:hypothetical protein N657DRAFT_646491 [Parathielavia appendiculata]